MAQFVYLLLSNQRIRAVLETVTSKAVLLIGRFSAERKTVLDALREALRQRGWVPVMFDFEPVASRDFTETIQILAGLARFVIVDLTDARSVPQELASFVPQLPSVPVQPIIQSGHEPWAIFADLPARYAWVRPPHVYDDVDGLLRDLDSRIVGPALRQEREPGSGRRAAGAHPPARVRERRAARSGRRGWVAAGLPSGRILWPGTIRRQEAIRSAWPLSRAPSRGQAKRSAIESLNLARQTHLANIDELIDASALEEGIMPSEHDKIDSQKVIGSLNTILELELAGVVRYLHYSLMVFGHARIPIIGWMRNQATEGMNHAAMAGEHVTSLGGHPSLNIGKLVESHKHDITQILGEALDHERATLREYYNLLGLVVDKSVWLEEYAREQITLEEQHIAEVDKMMRKPGELHPTG